MPSVEFQQAKTLEAELREENARLKGLLEAGDYL
jgi:hypothetical protein